MTIKCECDVCGQEGPIADFLFPRNNEPSFMREWDYSLPASSIIAERATSPYVYNGEQQVFLYSHIRLEGDGPTTCICKACFFVVFRKFMEQYGPSEPSKSSDPQLQSVQAIGDMSESSADESPYPWSKLWYRHFRSNR